MKVLGDAVRSFPKRQVEIAPLMHLLANAPLVFLGALGTTLTGWGLALAPSWI